MYLKDLTVHGFKSFAKKGELSFTTPITAIVGPNGSGKSNVAESFRFVLGEQSIKSMRGKRGEDLIFNGSEQASRNNRASVSITLDNATKIFPLDFEEIVVERVVHRDGTNEYLINGSKTRLKDVQELLAAANIGSTGHHIISQGEADRILSASPRERREMIEDALGLKVFQYKKAEAERKLLKTRENITEVELLRREVAPHLKFLERQMKKIERSLTLQSELTNEYIEYLRREDVYVAHHSTRIQTERRGPESQKNELEEALLVAREKLSQEKSDVRKDELMELEERVRGVRRKRQELLRKSGQLEGQIEYVERRIVSIESSENKESSPVPYASVLKAQQCVNAAIEKVRESTDHVMLKEALREIQEAVAQLLEDQNSESGRSTETEEKELSLLSEEQSSVSAQLEDVATEEEGLQKKYEELKAAIDAEATEGREAEREVFRLMNELREIDHILSEYDREGEGLDRDRNEFKRELQEAAILLGTKVARYFEVAVIADGVTLTDEMIVNEDRQVQIERRRELEKKKIRLEEMGVGATEEVEKEYKTVKERDEFLEREIEDLTRSVEKLETLITELTTELNEQFLEGIDKIDAEFSRFFTLMFGGGAANLVRVTPKRKKKDELEDEEDPEEKEEEGVDLDVKLPNKRVRGLDMLSGGERALTSIALIFAMSQVNPPLFVILDETDAALDEANSRRYGDMIEALAKRSQLILITHNRETMSRAGVLYGVTMGGDGVSKLLSVKLEEAVSVAK